MKKPHNNIPIGRRNRRFWMALLVFSLAAISFLHAANLQFTQKTVTAEFKDATLNEVLWEIQKQTDFTFVYSTKDLKNLRIKNLSVKNERIADVLNKCLKNSGLTYTVQNGVIAIKPIGKATNVSAPNHKTKLSGIVLDENNDPIIGANILVKGTTLGTTTDLDGKFNLETDDKSVILVVSYIGYTKQEMKIVPGKPIKISLKQDNNMIDGVIVTGYGTFKKSAYAGSASNVKA